MNNQKQFELTLRLDVMIRQLQQAVRAINDGNTITAGVYIEMVENQLLKAKWQVKGAR